MTNKNEIRKEPISRRSFFNKVWLALGTLAGIEVLGISLNFLFHFSGKKERKRNTLFIAGKVEDFKPGSVTFFSNNKFYLSRLKDGGFIALSLTCTHLGCSVGWNEKEENFICPCHSSIYTITGEVISPPAPRALDFFHVIIENNVVKININSSVKRERFEKSQVTYAEM